MAAREPSTSSQATPWPRVLVLFFAGVSVAFQIGKLPPALPAMRAELDLSLLAAGWLIAIFSIVTALGGVFLGAFAARFGALRTALAGMALSVIAGLAGSLAEGATWLLAMRALEGVGTVATAVAIPPILVQLAAPADRSTVLGMWGAYVPAGSGLIMLAAGPLLAVVGWRGLWLVAAAAIALAALAARIAARDRAGPASAAPPPTLQEIGAVARRGGVLLLCLMFLFYAAQYLAVTSFVPLILVEKAGLTTAAAAVMGALVVLANAVGNILTGPALKLGIAPLRLIQLASLAMAAGAAVVLDDGLPAAVRILGGAFFSGVGGFIPGTLFALAPTHAPRPELLATVNGIILQGAAIGQFVGPPVVAALTATSGTWFAALPAVVLAAATVAAFAEVLTRRERRLA